MEKHTKYLGEKLRELREDYDLSQSQVAAALNIDRSTYTNYELDKTRPSLEGLVKLAHIFNVSTDYLLPLDIVGREPPCEPQNGVGMVRSLNKDERGMVAQYRTLTRENRALIRRQIAELAQQQK